MKLCFRIFFFLALSILLMPTSRLWAQGGVSSSGTDYWLQFMPNGPGAGNTSVYEDLFIASGTDNKVTFSGGVATRTITMTAGEVYDYFCPNVMNSVDEVTQDDAIHITSENPVTIYGYSTWGNLAGQGDSPDGFLALPTPALGTEYYTINFPDNFVFSFGGSCSGEFLITSPYDNNAITITPAADTKGGHKAGQSWNITLSKGETYLVQSPGTDYGANDLTGTLIVSTKPISLLTGHQISSVPTDCACSSADNLFEMIPSVDRWGTQYFDEPMAGKLIAGDYLRVLSAENGNQITYTGALSGQHLMTLDSGQYQDITQNTESMTITSANHKRFIVAQYSYSQGMYGDPGLSDPWMVLFTPQEQFEKTMIFRTPTSTRGAFTNYLTFIALKDSLSKIIINGQPIGNYSLVGTAVFPNTNPVMGAQRILLAAQPKNYIATSPVPFGAYQYGFSNYEGYGWPTGMAQRLITPDTLPPLVQIVDSNCGNYNLLFTEPRVKPTFSFNDTKIASISMITAAGDPRWPTPSYNYTFTPNPNFIPGDSALTATLTVNNHKQDAYAAIYAVDLAGNDTVYQYHYYAPKIAFSPASPYDFGTVLDGTDSCRQITITNIQAGGTFNAESDSLAGTALGGSFAVTPTTLKPIPDSTSITLQVCFHPTDTGVVSLDSVYVISECVTYAVPVTGTGITPLIYANDLAFGEVDSGQTKCLPLTIYNRGKAPLTITAQNLVSDPNFSVNPAQVFPIIIPPGQHTTISYCFHPQSWGSFAHTVTFRNLNPTEFQHSIKDTALLTGIALPAGAQLTSYTKDFTVSCNDTTLSDTAFDNLPKDISVTSLVLGGPDSSFFSITQLSNSFLLKGEGADSLPFQILFNPTKNGLDLTPRHATIRVITAAGGPQPTLAIQAQLVTPIVQIAPNFIDLGTARINQSTLPKTFTITNTGNAPLVIPSYNIGGAGAASFTFNPPAPLTIAPGDSQIVTVTAENSQIGLYSGNGSLIATCNSVPFSYQANFSSVGSIPQGTTHPTTYVGGCRTNTQYATLQNLSLTDSITITDAYVTAANGWIDTTDFGLATPFQPLIVLPGKMDTIPIVFVPTATGTREAAFVFIIKGKNPDGSDTTWSQIVELQGTGAAVARQVGIGNVTAAPQYHSMAGNAVSIPVVVNTPIDENAPDSGTTEAYGYKFNISWKRDAFQYVATTPSYVIVDTPIYNKATGMESRLVHFESQTPLTGVTTLATIGVQSMLTKSDTTGIVLSNMQWLDKDSIALCYVSDTSFDGSHVLDPVCGNATLQGFLTTGAISVDGIRPDPAGASAEIDYTLGGARPISISIYDLLGNEVKQLMNMQPQTMGAHSIQFTSDGLASGAYYCRITDGHFVVSRQFEIAK